MKNKNLNPFSYIQKHNTRHHSGLSLRHSTINEKILGKAKHYPFTNKEWIDSTYTYNKTSLKEFPFKYKLANKLIKYHFNIDNLKSVARSRRMRNLIMRSSSKKIVIAKPEIKQTNDKTIITIYTYDRERQSLIRNLYFYNRKSSIYNLWLKSMNEKKIKKIKNLNSIVRKRFLVKRFPYHNIGFNNEIDFFKFRFLDIYKKLLLLNNNFMFLFISQLLLFFDVKIFTPFPSGSDINNKMNKKSITKIVNEKPKILILVDNKTSKLTLIKRADITRENLTLMTFQQGNNNYHTDMTTINREKLNNYLWYLTVRKFIDYNFFSDKQIFLLFVKLRNHYYNKIIIKYFRQKAKILYYFTKLEINKSKFSSLLVNLKRLISKVYYKKVELNIVNLKYIYLNSDIYTQFVINKLKKKIGVLRVLGKSLKLIKLPYHYILKNKRSNLNNLQILNSFTKLDLTNLFANFSTLHSKNTSYNDRLEFIFDKLFPNHVINNKQRTINSKHHGKDKITDILNSISYKWVKGMKLEIAGRLTRRNTASRSLFKLRTKGNLNSKHYYVESDSLKTLSTVMTRNTTKANLQYTSNKSKRRIGAFGVKSWISSF